MAEYLDIQIGMMDDNFCSVNLEDYVEKGSVTMTPKRLYTLKLILDNIINNSNDLEDIIRDFHCYKDDELDFDIHVGESLEHIGTMDFLLDHLYPESTTPKELNKFYEFTQEIKDSELGEDYKFLLENKIDRDLDLHDQDGRSDFYLYSKYLMAIVESYRIDNLCSRIMVVEDGKRIYESNIPYFNCENLSPGSTLIFEYSPEKLEFSLDRSLSFAKSEGKFLDENIDKFLESKRYYIENIHSRISELIGEISII